LRKLEGGGYHRWFKTGKNHKPGGTEVINSPTKGEKRRQNGWNQHESRNLRNDKTKGKEKDIELGDKTVAEESLEDGQKSGVYGGGCSKKKNPLPGAK